MGRLSVALLCAVFLLVSGCAGQEPLFSVTDVDNGAESASRTADEILDGDPGGPLAVPDIPDALREAAALSGGPRVADDTQSTIQYRVVAASPGAPELEDSFLATSPLNRLADIPVHTVTGLERRLKQSLDHGQEVLRSYGYYTGRVRGTIVHPGTELRNAPAGKSAGGFFGGFTRGLFEAPASDGSYTVRVTFQPGSLYHTGNSAILPAADTPGGEAAAADSADSTGSTASTTTVPTVSPDGDTSPGQAIWPGPPDAPQLPRTLADVGLPLGSPARASDVLAAIDRIQDLFRNKGYPFASVVSTRHILDHGKKELESEVRVRSGEFARMGDLELRGEPGIKHSYLENLITWEDGEPWNQDKVEAFREKLRGTSLFQAITLDPGTEADADGRRSIVTQLETAPPRTVGGALKYDTSFGVGVQAFWEHRNLTGRGDSLRLDLPVWQDMQEFSAKYRLPFFLSPKQDFIAQGAILNQDTDAYDIQAQRVAAGIERRISKRWTGTVMVSAEGGSIKDPDKSRRDYQMFGLPLSASWSDANSLLDATKGSRVMFSAAPYVGSYDGEFTALRTRVDAFTYLPLIGKDTLVLALKGSIGSVFGVDSGEVPPSVRFYSGGGGSVRGYEYQSLGPRNDKKDPLGGNSVMEVSVEPRWKITDTIGVVAFVDGGMVYDDTPDFEFGKDMRWGAGLGFRFYTAIGPIRFDVATPLNPRKDDDSIHFYISIGQSF
ncbi:BamA/TamA family outer membrane protein [Desulfovibrio sp. OttesenSCG-928-I05]|nr:BamA/TamA family outer membrane protein [Desulfovibrio sp. OttesenSCG-928-I05]